MKSIRMTLLQSIALTLSVRHHMQLLSAAGFQAADVRYKRDIFAIYAGVK
jgi:hypothetical protein